MAISFVASAATNGANNGANVTLTLPAGMQQNDLVVVAYANSSTLDYTMTTSSIGWTKITETYSNGTTYDINVSAWYKVMGSTPDTTFVGVGAANNAFATVAVGQVFRGVDPTTPIDVTAVTATGTGTGNTDPPAITPVTEGAWPVIVGAASAATAGSYNTPSDLTNFTFRNWPETNDAMVGMGSKSDWVSGAFNPAAWTRTTAPVAADSWAGISFALRPFIAGPVVRTAPRCITWF